MFSWIKKIAEEKPDHPLFNTSETRKFLNDLPANDPLAALDEITAWLTSVKDTPGFRPDNRAGVIMLLDEKGQSLQAELLRRFMAAPNLYDPQSLPTWQGIHDFMQALVEAYALCLREHLQAENNPLPLKEQMPLICVRLLHAVAGQMKLKLVRYLDVDQGIWDQLYAYYSIAETNRFAGTLVQAYPAQPLHTSPQRELLRALVLHTSSPATLAQNQIEACFHIAARLGGLFDFKPEPDPDCPYFIDLSNPGAPAHVDDNLQVTASMRFFGAVNALPKIEETIHHHELNMVSLGRNLHDEFTPDGKFTVLKHLQIYWRGKKRFRQHERQITSTTIQVAHGFENISRLVKNYELSKVTNLSEEDAAMLQNKTEMALVNDVVYYTPETWPILNLSENGIGGLIPMTAGNWVKIGKLCAVKTDDSDLWWTGMLRRMKTASRAEVGIGIKLFARSPLSVWLRSLGEGADKISNWDSSTGSFVYSYLPVILLPDARNSFVHATMLMESGSYAPGSIFEMMMGEKSCNIKLTALLEEGDDYELVSFHWLVSAHG